MCLIKYYTQNGDSTMFTTRLYNNLFIENLHVFITGLQNFGFMQTTVSKPIRKVSFKPV